MPDLSDPLRFGKFFWPDVRFYDKEREIIYSVRDNDETYVPAGNQLGKDYTAAFIILWFFLTRAPCRIVTTSVDHTQLEAVLWGEIRRFIQTSRVPLAHTEGGPLVVNHLHLRKMVGGKQCGISYCIGRVAAKGEGMLGHHVAHQADRIPRTLFVADEACHDQETEVLTEQGWRFFKALTGNERLLTMDPLTRIAEYRYPTAISATPVSKPMYAYERRCGNFCVTPEHRMLWKRYRAKCKIRYSPYYLQRLSEINGTCRSIPRCFVWHGERPATLPLPELQGPRKTWHGREVDARTWLEFLGWYLAEGNVGFTNGTPYHIAISQKDPATLQHVAGLARQLGFSPAIYTDAQSPNVRIGERRLAEYLHALGHHAWEKRIPEYIGTLAPDLIEVFLQAFKEGDGYDREGGREIYYTSSKAMADEIQVLSFKAGQECTVRTRRLIGKRAPNGFSRRDGYVVGRSRPGLDSHLKIKRQHLHLVDYSGMVYCACVPPYHTLFTRRDGNCIWSGNSGVDDVSYERATTWAKRCLVLGNPYPTNPPNNFFFRAVQGGDVLAKE